MNFKMNKPNLSEQKILMVFVIGLMLISFISAEVFTFDNRVDYVDESLLKVDIINVLGFEVLGSVELTSHSSVTEIKEVGFGGYNAVMYYDFTNWELYENGLGNVYFTNMKNGEDTEKLWYFAEWKEKQKEVPIYDYKSPILNKDNPEYPSYEIVGYENKSYWAWEEYNSRDIPNTKTETRRIALMVYTDEGEYTDAVWTLAGKRIKEHASWTAGLESGLINYYKMDEGTGSVLIDYMKLYNGTAVNTPTNTSGLINSGWNLSTNADYWI